MKVMAFIDTIISLLEKAIKAIKYFFTWRKQEFMKNIKKRYKKGMSILNENRDKVIQFLYKYYSSTNTKFDRVYTARYLFQDGHAQDLAIITRPNFLLATNPEFNIESTYGGLVNHFSIPESDILKAKKRWDAIGIVAYEGHKYSLHGCSNNGVLEFRDTTFHTYRASFGEVYDELALTIADKGIEKFSRLKKSKYRSCLPKRAKYLDSIDMLLNMNQRICAGGIITMLAARTNNDIAIVAQRRSARVSDEPNLLTLIPRAFHESIISPEKEFELQSTVYRECYEELLGGDDQVGPHMEPDFYLAENKAIRELVEGRGTNHILKPISLFWDLFRGNFIVAYCLYIKDASWWSQHGRAMKVNWEYSDKEKITAARASRSEVIRLINRKDWANDSYFAFIEGLRWLCTQEPELASIALALPELHLSPL